MPTTAVQHERKPILDKKDPNAATSAGQTTAQALTVGGGGGVGSGVKSTNASPQFQQRTKSSSSSSIFNHNLNAAAAAAAASNTAAAFALDTSNLAAPEIFGLNFAELTQTLSEFFKLFYKNT